MIEDRETHDNIALLTVSAVVIGIMLGAAVWLLIPALTGKKEAWDSFWPYYLSMVLGGFVLGDQ